jgi:flagellar basal body-associated protein FliL
MSWVTISIIFMIVVFLVVVGVDIFLLTRKSKATFSEILRTASRKWQPVVIITSFGMGLLSGHWFW